MNDDFKQRELESTFYLWIFVGGGGDKMKIKDEIFIKKISQQILRIPKYLDYSKLFE